MCSTVPNPKAFPLLKTASGVGSQPLVFISVTVTDTLAKTNLEDTGFIWLTIPGYITEGSHVGGIEIMNNATCLLAGRLMLSYLSSFYAVCDSRSQCDATHAYSLSFLLN